MQPLSFQPVAAALLLSIAACTSVPGDPDTIVVDGEPLAGYAWMGPKSDCCADDQGTHYVAWQIAFTNTEYCPARSSDVVAVLYIVSPETVEPPSTELPTLPSLTLRIETLFRHEDLFEPLAELGIRDFESARGTLTLSRYDTEIIAGSFEATGTGILDLEDVPRQAHGKFVAHRCSRLHD